MKVTINKVFYTAEELAEKWGRLPKEINHLILTKQLTAITKLAAIHRKRYVRIFSRGVDLGKIMVIPETTADHLTSSPTIPDLPDCHDLITPMNSSAERYRDELANSGHLENVVMADEVARYEAEHAQTDDGAAYQPPAGKWPWGDHNTKLLDYMVVAAETFWKNFDPTDNTTAPTNDYVAKWLMEQFGLTKRKADAIARVLRPDNLPPGPRT